MHYKQLSRQHILILTLGPFQAGNMPVDIFITTHAEKREGFKKSD